MLNDEADVRLQEAEPSLNTADVMDEQEDESFAPVAWSRWDNEPMPALP